MKIKTSMLFLLPSSVIIETWITYEFRRSAKTHVTDSIRAHGIFFLREGKSEYLYLQDGEHKYNQ